MPDEDKNTPEVAEIPAEIKEVVAEATPTVGDIRKETVEISKGKETVGLDKFLDLKRQNKESQQIISDLRSRIDAGETRQETSATIDAIATEFPDVDRGFLNKLASAIKNEVQTDADTKISERLRPIEEKEIQSKIDVAFTKGYEQAMANMPEFRQIVNPDVIKTLSLDPRNSNKTFAQIIEDTYGSALSGKRTIETTTPGGGKDTDPLNFERVRTDDAYFDVVMANPRLKKEYNERMLHNGF